MNAKKSLLTGMALMLVIAALAGTTTRGMAQGWQEKAGRTGFTAVLHGGELEKFVLGPAERSGGYVVDVTPLVRSDDGAYIEKQILPEFNGEIWVDVLTLSMPESVSPLKVRVQVYTTVGWPKVFESTLILEPGAWHGYMVMESASVGGYVIEINPQGAGQFGDRVERAIMQPEFTDYGWWDVLRMMIPAEQEAMEAEVIIYQTPSDLQVVMETEFTAEAGVWYGMGLGYSKDGGAYIIEVTPLGEVISQVERYLVQPEFDGQDWYDVARVMLTPEWPAMQLRVTVYMVGGG